MTDSDTATSPGGGQDAGGCTALDLFDAHGAAVFASLCRVSGGGRAVALDVLLTTFREMHDPDTTSPLPAGRSQIILAALRAYLVDPRSGDDRVSPDPAVGGEQTTWTSTWTPTWAPMRQGRAIEALRGLSAGERIALELRLMEPSSVESVGAILGCDPALVDGIVADAEQRLRASAPVDSAADVLRSGELWFGDDERAVVRAALGASAERAAGTTPVGRARVPFRIGWPTIGGVALVAGLTVIGVQWVQGLPRSNDVQPVETILAPPDSGSTNESNEADTTDQTASDQDSGATVASRTDVVTTIDVTPVEGSVGAPDVFIMASGLDKPTVLVPEFVIRYADGKVGLSWRSPCNRPAIGVSLTATTTGAAIELTTGEFPVRSCLGMPDRWSAVVRPSRPIPEGAIEPIGPRGTVPDDWDGLVEAGGPAGSADELSDGALYGSALVDDANQPWVYGLGCSSRSAQYLSPIGAIFEIRRAETIDPDSYSSSDAIVCTDLASRQVLTGPLGATFPNAQAEPTAAPRACPGPAGSWTDVAAAQPFSDRISDGEWSTWDGCLVRADVIFSESIFETCVDRDVRTITFATELGQRIEDGTAVLRYLRDPDGVVSASLDPFRAYQIPSSDVHDTGLRYGDEQLWVSNETDLAIYVRNGRAIERWPRFEGAVSCAPATQAG